MIEVIKVANVHAVITCTHEATLQRLVQLQFQCTLEISYTLGYMKIHPSCNVVKHKVLVVRKTLPMSGLWHHSIEQDGNVQMIYMLW